MSVPSIKGSAFGTVVADVKQLIESGRIGPEDLAEQLSEKDRGFLDAIVVAVGWFPIATYGRLLELLAIEEGGDDPVGYLRERGARAAEQLLSSTYESYATEPGSWGPRVGRAMVGIGGILYNFTSWSFEAIDEQTLKIESRDAVDFPDVARYTAEGFLQWFANHAANQSMRVESTRPSPDRIVFHLAPA